MDSLPDRSPGPSPCSQHKAAGGRARMPGAVGTLLALTASLLLAAPHILAQEPEEFRDASTLHYAFARYLGSGIYRVENSVIQVYHISGTFFLRSEEIEDRRWGVHLQLPVTVGIYELTTGDVDITDWPDRLATISFVPRLKVPVRVGKHWTLGPFGDLGAVKDLDRGQLTWLFGLGMKVDATYPVGRFELRPGFLGVWAHHTEPDMDFGDDFSKLESGLDFRIPLGFRIRGEEADFGLFGKNYLYLEELELLTPEGDQFDLQAQWEVGATFGTRRPFKWLGVQIPRVGLSFRFGDGVTAFRVVFGNPV